MFFQCQRAVKKCISSTCVSWSFYPVLALILSLQGRKILMTKRRIAKIPVEATRMVAARARAPLRLPLPRLPLPRLLHLKRPPRTPHPRVQLPRVLPRAPRQGVRRTVHHPQSRPGRGGARVTRLSQQLKGARQTTVRVSQSHAQGFDILSPVNQQDPAIYKEGCGGKRMCSTWFSAFMLIFWSSTVYFE